MDLSAFRFGKANSENWFDPTSVLNQERHKDVSALSRALSKLLPKMRIAVVHAGDKADDGAVINATLNTRSWKSYKAVAEDIAQALTRASCPDVVVLPEDMRLAERLQAHGTDFVWLNTAGVQGRSSAAHASAMLEMLGVPYLGHDPLDAALLDNKAAFKKVLTGAGIPTAAFATIPLRDQPFEATDHAGFARRFAGYDGPFIVKPVNGRASIDVCYAADLAALEALVTDIGTRTRNTVLIERFLGGREFCVAVCGRTIMRGGHAMRGKGPFIFSTVERRLDPGEHVFTSMDKRPISADRGRLLDPMTECDLIGRLHGLAAAVFETLDLDTLVRLDIRADELGALHVLEANPKPDLKAPAGGTTSLVAMGLQQEQMTYDDLILSLLADRIDRLTAPDGVPHDALMRLMAG